MSDSYSRVPADSAEATRDLQDRVGRFVRTTFVISGVMLVASISMDIALGIGLGGLSRPSRSVHLAAQVLLLLGWLLCRGKTRALALIHVLDAGLTIVVCTGWAVLGLGIPKTEAVEFSIMLATTYTLIARSVIVPSSFARTAWISAVSVVPTAVFFLTRGMAFVPNAAPDRVRTFLAFSMLWLLVAVFVAALNSRQLYGLRQQIREVRKLGQYTLEQKLGEGGMGVVYRATHAMLRRPAAIKLLLPNRTGEKNLARFEREVQLTSRLAHPNTISIFDYGRTADGVFYYVMEYLDGFDLQRLVDSEGALGPTRVIRILAQASGALGEAHALGLVHRDVKPANIILTQRVDELDVVKVVDFGLVRTVQGSSGDVGLTDVNTITGTPMYMAPEAITDPDSVDAQSDLYALGVVGYLLLTGKPLFEADSVVAICSQHLLAEPVPPSVRLGRAVPADLEALILACLEKPRARRPASAQALRAALLACNDAPKDDSAELERWWRERGAELRARKERPQRTIESASAGETMAIDLRGRGLSELPTDSG
jgi:eukaryotic-like serine/threonine-protein kinase